MADYTQPDVVHKRVRFFDGQFLQDQDFIDEQRYHLDRERRQSTLLRVTGIVSGLTVTSTGTYQVTVAKGVAVDDLGRQLVLANDLILRLTDKFANKQNIEVRLVYQETPTDMAQTGGEGFRRWDESPKVVALAPDGTVAVAPDGAEPTWKGPTVLLAKLTVAGNGDVTVDATVAVKAGLSVPGAIGIGTTGSESKLTVSASQGHVQLRREKTENTGGPLVYMELYQDDATPPRVPEVAHGIHFRHHNRFSHLIEAQNRGFHFKDTNPANKGRYSDINSGRLTVTGSGGTNVDLVVNGRLRSNNNDGGLWVAEDRFVGGHSTNQIGFFNGGSWRLTVLSNGNVGIGTTEPENAENWERVVDILGRWNVKLSLRAGSAGSIDTRVMAHNGGVFGAHTGMIVGTKSDHALSFVTNATTRLSITSTGNVGIGITRPPWKLSVSSSKEHLALYRGSTETAGGTHVFLELAQIDSNPARVPEVFPCIRFNHHNRFAHRIEGRESGFHFKIGDPTKDDYSDIRARNVTATGVTATGLGVDRGLIRMGRLDGSRAVRGEVLGGIGFLGMGVQHGVLSFRAGFGFELVDQSSGALHLDYARDSIPYADLKMRNLVANNISGKLAESCSIAFKEEVETLNDDQLSRLYHDTLRTDVVTFRYKESALQDRRSLGVIAERCPEYIVGSTGASVNQIEYTAMLHGAVKVLAERVGRLEEALAADLALPNDRERPDRNRTRPPTPD